MSRTRRNSTESTNELARQQTSVIADLVRGATVTDATRQAGVDRSTYYLWLRSDATFEAELNRAEREQIDAMRAQLGGLADAAVSTIREMLTGADVPAGLRLKAALAVLQATGALESGVGATDPEAIEQERRQQSLLNSLTL
jgi:hypothetical protein